MRIQWYGQSAFALTRAETSVFIDPFGDMSARSRRADAIRLPGDRGRERRRSLLVTHEHLDHNGVEAIGGRPARSSARPRATSSRRSARSWRSRPSTTQVAGTQRGPEHDLRVQPRRPAGRSLRRLRPGRAARRAGGGDRPGRPRCSCRSAAARRSTPRRRARSSTASARAGSCRCTTARRAIDFLETGRRVPGDVRRRGARAARSRASRRPSCRTAAGGRRPGRTVGSEANGGWVGVGSDGPGGHECQLDPRMAGRRDIRAAPGRNPLPYPAAVDVRRDRPAPPRGSCSLGLLARRVRGVRAARAAARRACGRRSARTRAGAPATGIGRPVRRAARGARRTGRAARARPRRPRRCGASSPTAQASRASASGSVEVAAARTRGPSPS